MIPGVDYAGAESRGDREYQEDFHVFCPVEPVGEKPTGLLAILADGMGGHVGGAHASKAVVETFGDKFVSTPGEIKDRLRIALDASNRRLSLDIKGNPALDGMGCTLVGAHLDGGVLQWVSVGDSHLYLYRDGNLEKLNADHSMGSVFDKAVEKGMMSAEEAANHPDRNALRSAVSGVALDIVDLPEAPISLENNDILILASDGLDTLSWNTICDRLAQNQSDPARNLSAALVSAVEDERRPRQDNTTVQVIHALGKPDQALSSLVQGPSTESGLRRLRAISKKVTIRFVILSTAVLILFLALIAIFLMWSEPSASPSETQHGVPGVKYHAPAPILIP